MSSYLGCALGIAVSVVSWGLLVAAVMRGRQ